PTDHGPMWHRMWRNVRRLAQLLNASTGHVRSPAAIPIPTLVYGETCPKVWTGSLAKPNEQSFWKTIACPIPASSRSVKNCSNVTRQIDILGLSVALISIRFILRHLTAKAIISRFAATFGD